MTPKHCVAWNDVPETKAANGVAKRVLDGAGAALVTVTIPAGTVGERHSHPHEQFVQVLAGSGALVTEQGESRFGPGSVFYFPAGTWHSAHFVTETTLVETNLRS